MPGTSRPITVDEVIAGARDAEADGVDMQFDPDIVFTTGMSQAGGEDVFASLRESGVCVADIPSSTSIAEIGEDLKFIGTCVGAADKAQAQGEHQRP